MTTGIYLGISYRSLSQVSIRGMETMAVGWFNYSDTDQLSHLQDVCGQSRVLIHRGSVALWLTIKHIQLISHIHKHAELCASGQEHRDFKFWLESSLAGEKQTSLWFRGQFIPCIWTSSEIAMGAGSVVIYVTVSSLETEVSPHSVLHSSVHKTGPHRA